MKMGVRIAGLAAVLVLLAGCSSTPKESSGGVMTSGDVTSAEAPGGAGGAGAVGGTPLPGTEQDLVVNVGDRVFFAYNQYDLSAEAKATIEKQAQWLKTYPNVNVMIEGHCDERGTREYNLALGEKRANAERSYLTALGIPASRIQTISYGKERPAVMGSDESAWAQNRRAVVVVQ
jgi:peptidoglycan-associated lipoprotein